MSDMQQTAVLGAGTIGASWTALLLAAGRSVTVFDPAPSAEKSVREYVERAWPALEDLGLTARATPDAMRFVSTAAEAVDGAAFIQENVPERLPLKHQCYAEIEPALAPKAIVSSSTSGLTLEDLQEGWKDPSPLLLGHPFNPPHLIPLVELTANAKTGSDVLERSEAFYHDIGKVTIRIKKGMPGHVANRLQAALWREAVFMAVEGVASVEDIDKAVWAGPGLRWSVMGPTSLFHLGAGDGGLEKFCEHFQDTFNGWWAGMGDPTLDEAAIKTLVEGMNAQVEGQSVADLAAKRDAMLVAVQAATKPHRNG